MEIQHGGLTGYPKSDYSASTETFPAPLCQGFEPQIMRIVQNVRPDRQTVMFSATFPRQVETLARKILIDPIEIQVSERWTPLFEYWVLDWPLT